MSNKQVWPVGVFTSIDAGLGVRLDVAHSLNIHTIQLHAPHTRSRTAQRAREFLLRIGELGIELTAVFGGFDGESYADIPTVARTVGLVPPETRTERLKEMTSISDFAHLLECNAVALHLGCVPHDSKCTLFRDVVAATQALCSHCQHNGQALHLETGQETAEALLQFVRAVGAGNLFVNFDPANMILYGTGEPIEALRKIGPLVRSVHCKDAVWSDQPGVTWGREVPLGEGDVDCESYLRTLREIGYLGPLTIEREIPHEPERQKVEIGHAAELLRRLKSRMKPVAIQ